MTKNRFFPFLMIPSIFLLHLFLILSKGYFLSTEFTLYPYLTSLGFLPYSQIIDQHFPVLLFGPLSIPYFLVSNPKTLLAFFFFITFATDLFFYFSLRSSKIKFAFLWTFLFILMSSFFSGNILWFEVFVNFLLSICFFLSRFKNKKALFAIGVITSQIILLRPTIAPAMLLILISQGISISPSLIFGGVLGVIPVVLYLYLNNLFNDFYQVAIVFNSQYTKLGLLYPAKRDLLKFFAITGLPVYFIIKNKRYLNLASLVLLFFLAYPRFGFEHLQPFILCLIFFAANTPQTKISYSFLLIPLIFILSLASAIKTHYGNFYFSERNYSVAEKMKKLEGNEIYLFGVPDILYPLSGKVPAGKTYLPSLTWYHSQKNFSSKVIDVLQREKPTVIADENSTIDGVKLIDNNPIWDYIKINYHIGGEIDGYQLYLPNP